MSRALMFGGTGSDVGKSLLVAGLCRLLADRGLRVRPFKPQNMSNNAAVTADGGEIGRAQALQARAARVPPHSDMNPVLLKPQDATGAQVVVGGKVWRTARAAEYQALKPDLLRPVLDGFGRLRGQADIVLVEGAGSVAEVNLRAGDIANFGFARAADVPVVVIGDIDRGGVIASLVGTRHVIAPQDAALVAGFLVNRFRGDPTLFSAGMERIARDTGWRTFGLVPHFEEARRLPAEDGLALRQGFSRKGRALKVAVPMLPFISNFDDLDPLDAEPGVEIVPVWPGAAIPGDAALVVLPGSKSTIADLRALKDAGFDTDIRAHLRRGGHVLGLCGGFQMLGRTVSDPDGVEGSPATVAGLGHLDVATVLSGEKRLETVAGRSWSGAPLAGYEIHMGRTDGPDAARPFATLDRGHPDGARSADGRVTGTYLHGLFADDGQRADWIGRLGGVPSELAYEAEVDRVLDRLAAHLALHLDVDGLLSVAR